MEALRGKPGRDAAIRCKCSNESLDNDRPVSAGCQIVSNVFEEGEPEIDHGKHEDIERNFDNIKRFSNSLEVVLNKAGRPATPNGQ